MITAMMDFLALRLQQGDADGMLSVAQSMLATIPDDLVALQFMALGLFWLGRREHALIALRKAAAVVRHRPQARMPSACEQAADVTLREAKRPELSGGWRQIAHMTELLGLQDLAQRARVMSDGADTATRALPARACLTARTRPPAA